MVRRQILETHRKPRILETFSHSGSSGFKGSNLRLLYVQTHAALGIGARSPWCNAAGVSPVLV